MLFVVEHDALTRPGKRWTFTKCILSIFGLSSKTIRQCPHFQQGFPLFEAIFKSFTRTLTSFKRSSHWMSDLCFSSLKVVNTSRHFVSYHVGKSSYEHLEPCYRWFSIAANDRQGAVQLIGWSCEGRGVKPIGCGRTVTTQSSWRIIHSVKNTFKLKQRQSSNVINDTNILWNVLNARHKVQSSTPGTHARSVRRSETYSRLTDILGP